MGLCLATDNRMSSIINHDVIEACRGGDKEAFGALFETYQDRVYSISLYFFSGNDALAKDVTQQVFLKLFTRIHQFRQDAEFTTWLYRLVINTCKDEQRKRRRFIPFTDLFLRTARSDKASQEQVFMRGEMEESVKLAILSLKPKLRLAILLKYVEGFSYAEIADVLGCSMGTVASRLNRGHEALARRLAHLRGAAGAGESK